MARNGLTNGLTIEQLEQLLESRRGRLAKLERERGKLARRMEQLDAKIQKLGGRGGTRVRVRNTQSLLEMIEGVLKSAGKTMRVGEITEAVQKRGYRSSSANFRGIVNQTLIKDKRFGQAGRGMYQLKK